MRENPAASAVGSHTEPVASAVGSKELRFRGRDEFGKLR